MRPPPLESGGRDLPSGYAVLPVLLAAGALGITACGSEEPAPVSGRKPRDLQETVHAPFAARLELPLVRHKVTGTLAIDADGDGNEELVEVSRVPGGLYYWDRLRGGFDAENAPLEIPLGAYGLGPVAFDAARPTLVAAASQETSSVHLFDLSRKEGEETLWVRELEATPTALAAGRLEGDDHPVLAVITEAEQIHLFDEHGEKKVHALASREGDYPTVLHFLESGSELVVLFGDGAGGLAQRAGSEPRLFGTGVGAIWCSDLNGDGPKDVVVSDPEGGRIVLFEGTGKATDFRLGEGHELAVVGGPAALNLLPAQGERPLRLCVGLEGAGQENGLALFDVLVADDGRVRLEHSGSLPAERRTGGIACADFDGDSRCDLAFLGLGGGDVSPGEIFIWRCDDEGELQHFATLSAGLAPYMIVAADLNGDGRADLASNAQHSHHVSVWLSRSGVPEAPFLRLVDFGVGRGPLDLCATDMDLDGRINLVVADNYNSSVSTLFNRIPPEVAR